MKHIVWILGSVAILAAAGCTSATTESPADVDEAADEAVGEADDALTLSIDDPCATIAADATYNYASAGYGKMNGPNGGYHYRAADPSTTCRFFVGDVVMPAGSDAKGVVLGGGPYNLPGSASYGGVLPTNAEDCGRLKVDLRFYRKNLLPGVPTPAAFPLLGKVTREGVWDATAKSCSFVDTAGDLGEVHAQPPAAGTRVYRVAVLVKERTSAQTAAVTWELPPAK